MRAFLRLVALQLHGFMLHWTAVAQYNAWATGFTVRELEFNSRQGARDFHDHRVQDSSGAHPASCPVVPGAVSLRVKRSGRECDQSPPSSVKIKNVWS
jgi:hypothetical protein